ncbi:MAG: type I-B CRISPR-associated protein Cas7/Cst2/DevR [Candidatus Bathyarchaeia archaeon]
MSKVVQISILGRISGNVNADGVIGNRITLKRMYSSDGEVLPFVSARAVKYAIRQAFKERGFDVDPFYEDPTATEALRLRDSGRPDKYIDNDLFGYMLTVGRNGETFRRYAPVALSYFKALKDTAIKSEFAARFPRPCDDSEKESNPVPFEVEVADFIGRLSAIIYDYVGDFTKSTRLVEDVNVRELERDERIKRLSAFLEILLTPSYVLPRRTNSLNIPEYYAALYLL